MDKIKLAFYKGKGTIVDKLIRFRTTSAYSHCELIIDDFMYSSSPRDGGVRKRDLPASLNDGVTWDIVEYACADKESILKFFDSTNGKKYDWLGVLLGQVLYLDIQNKDAWFCSEWCATALGFDRAWSLSPEGLYYLITTINKVLLESSAK